MAELVAAREGKGVCDGEHESNNCQPVRTQSQSRPHSSSNKLTNKRQPDKVQSHKRQDSQRNPQHGLRIQGDPKEALVRGIDLARRRVGALKHPAPVARRRVDFVPPAQPHEAPACNVLEVVEVHGQQQHGDDEDHDEVGGQEAEAEDVDEDAGWRRVRVVSWVCVCVDGSWG
jgi:hypothetical protein